MFKFLKALGVLAVSVWSVGAASASTLEDIDVTYIDSPSFTLSGVSFSLPPSGSNLLSGGAGSFAAGSGTIVDEKVYLVSGDTYTFAFNGSFGSGSAPILASSSGLTGGEIISFADGAKFSISANVAPVPLPASFPLFALALIALGAIGYRTARTKDRFAAVSLS